MFFDFNRNLYVSGQSSSTSSSGIMLQFGPVFWCLLRSVDCENDRPIYDNGPKTINMARYHKLIGVAAATVAIRLYRSMAAAAVNVRGGQVPPRSSARRR